MRRALMVALLCLATTAGADAPPQDATNALSDRFEILELVDGMALRPLEPLDVRLLEIRDGRIAADGETLDHDALVALVGAEDASWIEVLASSADSPAAAGQPADDGVADEDGTSAAAAADRQDQPANADPPRTERPDRSARVERTAGRFSVGSGVTIALDESAEDVVVIFGPAVVRGEVRGTVFVLGGRVEIDGGTVDGSVASIGGDVRLRKGARIGGDVVSVGGDVRRDRDVRIRGEVTEIAADGLPGVPWPRWLRPSRWQPDTGSGIGNTIALLLMAWLIVFAARRTTGAVAERLTVEPVKAGVVGVVVQILAVPVILFVTVALAVSIIGIPLLILVPISVLALIAMMFLGYTASALTLGRMLVPRATVGTAAVVAAGVVLIQAGAIAGALMYGIGGLLAPLGWMILAAGFLVKYLAWTAGLGAVVLHVLTPTPRR